MNHYFEECVTSHVAGMRNRLERMKRERDQMNAAIEALEYEVTDIEAGLRNWKDEALEQ